MRKKKNILLAQIEELKPDLVLKQDLFHVDTRLARRIKQIGDPILTGQLGTCPRAPKMSQSAIS
ncbi:hypothetical protein ACWAUC_12560 [Bradyrhizobium guangdongense]